MCISLDLDAYTSNGELAERGYEDAVIASLSEAIDQTDSALATVRGYTYDDVAEAPEKVVEGLSDSEDVEAPDTHRATLEANVALHAAVQSRLATLALEIGVDPEEALYHV